MGSSKKQTTGYWYRMGLHLGLCHGPIDELQEIRAGDRSAWSGQRYDITYNWAGFPVITPVSNSPVVDNEQILISARDLFGGYKREGGIEGYLDVMMGGPSQGANDYLSANQDGPQSGYRGIATVVFRGGYITANNPYIKPWAFRAMRIVSGWDGAVWYPEKAAVDVTEPAPIGGDPVPIIGMNPAHIVFECLTNRAWGLGYPSGTIDFASFTAAADTFHSEGMGLCIQWARQESISNFIQLVCDHAGAALGEDPRTGLWRLKAIRDDYDIGDLPVFSAAVGSIKSLDSFERAAPTETINALSIGYTDIKTGKDASVTVHQLANITAQVAIVPQTRSYPGIPTASLAGRVASRDLRTAAASLARVTFTANRAAYGLLPGDVIAFSWPELGVQLMALRIGKVNYGSLERGEIKIEAVEDIFGLPDSSYIKPPPIDWVEPERDPQPSPNVAAFEVPFRDLAQAIGAANAGAISASSGFLAGVARKPSGLSLAFELRTRIGSAVYTAAGDGDWSPTATLAANITPTTTSVTLSNVIDLGFVGLGDACLIGDEICRVDNLNVITNAITVGRGCADTSPRAWPAGTRVWFYDGFAAGDSTEYIATDIVDAKFVTLATGGELAEASAPVASVTMTSRAIRPYAPGDLRINTERYPAEAWGALIAAWTHRDRLLQQDTLIDHLQGNIGPESGTTYTARWYLDGGLVRTQAGITGTSDTYTPPAGSGGRTVRVDIEAVRGGYASWQAASHTFTYRAERFTEAGDRRVTEAGDVRILE